MTVDRMLTFTVMLLAAAVLAQPLHAKPNTRVRAEIPEDYRWDLSHIYPSWEAWEADLGQLQTMMDEFVTLKGTLANGPEQIVKATSMMDSLGMLAYKVGQYASLRSSEDTRDNSVQARMQQVYLAFAKFGQATAWYQPELLQIPWDTMKGWIEETPDLADHAFPIQEMYRTQEHVLDEDGEQLLAFGTTFRGTPSQIYQMLSTADVQFPTITLSNGEEIVASDSAYVSGQRSMRNQADREVLFKGRFEEFANHVNTYAAIYNAVLQRDWAQAQARGYSSTLAAALDGNAIPESVVENLIETAKQGAGPLQRYHELRKQALGLERYRYFDAYIPLVDVDWPMTFDAARELVVDSVAIYGEDYQKTVQNAFDQRWIDVYENEGKRSGAFSAGVYGVHPYMLLNYGDTLNDAFTLAHEMGHTMHTVLANSNQPFATSDYTIFVAEVASMTNENLFLQHLLETTTDPKQRVVLLQLALDDIAQGFYRQAMFADYELKAHRAVEQGQPITAEVLQQLYLGSLHDFFGDSLDDQEWYANTWARVSHFYGAPYYVYQYATSKSAASLLFTQMMEAEDDERAEVVERYLALLKSGGNDHPVTQMQKAGVDFTTPEPMEALVATMDRLVTQLEQELTAIGALPQ